MNSCSAIVLVLRYLVAERVAVLLNEPAQVPQYGGYGSFLHGLATGLRPICLCYYPGKEVPHVGRPS